MEKPLFSVKEASKYLGVGESYMRKLVDSGQIIGLKLGRVKIRKIDLDDFLAKNLGKDCTDPYNVKEM
ncbi:MAG: helix-turn-helix domain-containing protein [Cetobacterium sp.]